MQELLLTAALFLFAPLTRAQTPTILPLPDIHSQQQLDATILALHNAYFGAYNTCDLAEFAALTDEHVEFYHDTGGITLGRDALVKSIHDNICGKTTSETPSSITCLATNQQREIEFAQHLRVRTHDARSCA